MKTEENYKLNEELKEDLLNHCQEIADEKKNKMILRLLLITLGIGFVVIIASLVVTGRVEGIIYICIFVIAMFFAFLGLMSVSRHKAEALMEGEEKKFLEINLGKCEKELQDLKEEEAWLLERKEAIAKLLEGENSLV